MAAKVAKIRTAIKRCIESYENECCKRARDREALRIARRYKKWGYVRDVVSDIRARVAKRRKGEKP